jgi:hypothetical protein
MHGAALIRMSSVPAHTVLAISVILEGWAARDVVPLAQTPLIVLGMSDDDVNMSIEDFSLTMGTNPSRWTAHFGVTQIDQL